jgi:hypothetical protein
MRSLFILTLISFNALAVEWDSMIEGKEFKLTQSFSLKQNERSGSMLDVTRGEKFLLKEIVPLGTVPVYLFLFHYKKCPGPAMTTEMEIITVHGTSPVVEIGAQLEENCELNIFLENKDFSSNSFFE